MDHSAGFMDAPSQEDVSHFFSLEGEINSLPLSPAQKTRKEEILKNITQYLGSKGEFTRFLRQLENLRDEVKTESSRPKAEQPEPALPAGNVKFDAYVDQFALADEEKLRQLIREEVERLKKDQLVFLYTVTIALGRCLKPEGPLPSPAGR